MRQSCVVPRESDYQSYGVPNTTIRGWQRMTLCSSPVDLDRFRVVEEPDDAGAARRRSRGCLLRGVRGSAMGDLAQPPQAAESLVPNVFPVRKYGGAIGVKPKVPGNEGASRGEGDLAL